MSWQRRYMRRHGLRTVLVRVWRRDWPRTLFWAAMAFLAACFLQAALMGCTSVPAKVETSQAGDGNQAVSVLRQQLAELRASVEARAREINGVKADLAAVKKSNAARQSGWFNLVYQGGDGWGKAVVVVIGGCVLWLAARIRSRSVTAKNAKHAKEEKGDLV